MVYYLKKIIFFRVKNKVFVHLIIIIQNINIPYYHVLSNIFFENQPLLNYMLGFLNEIIYTDYGN